MCTSSLTKENEAFENHLIDHLNSENIYPQTIELISPQAVKQLRIASEWNSILSLDSREARVRKTLELWGRHAPKFDILIGILKACLISVDTILYRKELYVVYSLKVLDEIAYYVGKSPKISYENTVINALPKDIISFYQKVHDGFVSFPFESMGFASANDLYCLGDDLLQSEFLDAHSVADTYMIFSNGCGDGVVYDISKIPAKGFVYFHDDLNECEFEGDMIDIICTWIRIYLIGV